MSTIANRILPEPGLEDEPVPRHSLDSAAFYGLAGEVVRTILPQTEADPAALLINFLVAFGSVVGQGAFSMADGSKHPTNLFVVLVGDSSRGRKGTSTNRIKDIFRALDPKWAKERIHSGLSSGEGLISAVSSSNGEADPRMLVVESEFASTLAVMSRSGNTLSAVVRQAWDSSSLQTMVRRDPLRVDRAHVSIIAHVTIEELRRNLGKTETSNGFANRFLWFWSERSKYLPEGGSLQDSEVLRLVDQLRPAVTFASRSQQIRRSPDAKDLWAGIYSVLTDGRPGLSGAVTSRAPAQVLRLSSLYALLDLSATVEIPHLKAALAVWDYAAESAERVFHEAASDPVADSILEALRQKNSGMTRTELSGLFARNHTKARISMALKSLEGRGLATATSSATQGRSVEIWTAVCRNTK